MMGRISMEESFGAMRRLGKKALIAYTMAGDPDSDVTPDILGALADAGADLLELGIPFSDPVADGPSIQEASHRALLSGTTVPGAIKALSVYRKSSSRQVPVVLMTYLNPILRYGLDDFTRDASGAGADALIVPDLPIEEMGMIKAGCARNGLALVLLAAPTSPDSRLESIGKCSDGFVYMVSRAGVTGTRQGIPTDLAGNIKRLRGYTTLPIAVGFGIESPEDALDIAGIADGVIIGSAIVDRIRRIGITGAATYIGEVREALDSRYQ